MAGPRTAEDERLEQDAARTHNWKRWGVYLPERQWGTVREDYSPDLDVWRYFSHDHARSRAYRWGEDGLLGLCDRQGRLCFALALWNERDAILKERLFGLANHEGNHGEDVKELYFYRDATPTCSFARATYLYPHAAYPYEALVAEAQARGRDEPELEVDELGLFEGGRYFEITVTYAKASPDDIVIEVHAENRGPVAAPLHLLPTVWFRNTWGWGRTGESYWPRPEIRSDAPGSLVAHHPTLPTMSLTAEAAPEAVLFTDNETNTERLYGVPNAHPFTKDAFHRRVVDGDVRAVRAEPHGTKAAFWYRRVLGAGESVTLRLRLRSTSSPAADATATLAAREQEANAFYAAHLPEGATDEERRIARTAYAGLLWTKQFYHLVADHWLEGDPAHPPPPEVRKGQHHRDWRHLYSRDVLSVPDKWEYPWFAAWDLAFHMLPMARIDAHFAKEQLLLLLREWYMHPNGHIPAYEFAFGDVNPPVHAWAAFRTYKIAARRGERDRRFLARVFQKLLLNFTWWVNRKDEEGNNLFAGGFLGLDNVGLFDRSKPLPGGYRLRQSDGTAWMAFYAVTMLAIALELAKEDPVYEDVASKFFEHFIGIVDAMNHFGGTGLWNEEDGFYYDQLHRPGETVAVRARSVVGVIPLFAVEILDEATVSRLPGFRKRLEWFIANRPDLARHISCGVLSSGGAARERLLAVPSRERLVRVLRYVLSESELLSPYGVRSLSRAHREQPVVFEGHRVEYAPGDSPTGLFGGNSNWRGPVWFPLNYLLIESLQKYHHFYGDSLQVELPTGSGRYVNLDEVARELSARLARLYLAPAGQPPVALRHRPFFQDGEAHRRGLYLFYEYFHGDDGHGLGAEHQTGWTALLTRVLEDEAQHRRTR